MKRPLSSSARALLTTGLCVILIEIALACVLPASFDPRSMYPFFSFYAPPALEASVVQWQMDILLSQKIPKINVLVLGDSSCLMSIDARTVERVSGQRVWNLGTLGWISTEGHAQILQTFLETHDKPDRILYNITLYPLTTPLSEVKKMGYYDTFLEWLHLRKETTGFQIPSYRLRRVLSWKLPKWLLPMALRNRPRGPYPSDAELQRLLLENQGGMSEPKQMAPLTPSTRRNLLTPDCVPGLQHLFSLSDAYQVPIHVILNPLPMSYRSPLLDSDLAQLGRDVEGVAAGHPRVSVRVPFFRYQPDLYFGNLFHLNQMGAPLYSEDLGRWLKRLPPVSRERTP